MAGEACKPKKTQSADTDFPRRFLFKLYVNWEGPLRMGVPFIHSHLEAARYNHRLAFDH